MGNATQNLRRFPYGKGGREITTPVKGGAHIYEGTLVSQVTASGLLVPTTTAGAGPACGISSHEQDATGIADAVLRATILTDQIFALANDGANPASEATLLGAPLYATDDHTVSPVAGSNPKCGVFAGMEPDGKVRCFVTFLRAELDAFA